MADNQTATGGRDDLHSDSSRCLRMRFSESTCRRCIEICPHSAVTIDGGLAINPDRCRGCLLCTVVCPVGALEQQGDFATSLAQLCRVPEPLLGCIRTKELSHAHLTCLGGLSEEHLVALYHTLTKRLTINLSGCGACPNSPITSELKRQLAAVAAAGLAGDPCRIDLAEAAQDVHFHDESVDRRSFFKSFGNALLKNAAIILSGTNGQHELRHAYAEKRVPLRRELLNKTRAKLSRQSAASLSKHFDWSITFAEGCSSCQGCVAICPTGALQTDSPANPPAFDQLRCTGCGLCVEFCFDGAIQLSAENSAQT